MIPISRFHHPYYSTGLEIREDHVAVNCDDLKVVMQNFIRSWV